MNLYEATLQIARSIKDTHLKTSALGSVVAALEKSGDLAHSEEIFKEVLGDAHAIQDPKRADSALGLIAIGLLQASNFERVWQVVKLIQDAQSRDSTLWDIVVALTEKGNPGIALEFAHAIQEHASYKALAYQQIAYALAESGKFDQAIEVTHAIQEGRRKTVTLMQIATTLAEKGNVTEALHIAQAIPDEEEQAYLLIDIAAVLAEAGHIEHALEVAQTVQREPFKTYAFLDISKNILTLNLDEPHQTELADRIMKAFQQ
jgi:tetratricopeptide (TPR) repeat protein